MDSINTVCESQNRIQTILDIVHKKKQIKHNAKLTCFIRICGTVQYHERVRRQSLMFGHRVLNVKIGDCRYYLQI